MCRKCQSKKQERTCNNSIRGNYKLLLVGNKMDRGLPGDKVLALDAFGDVCISLRRTDPIWMPWKERMYQLVGGDNRLGDVVVTNVRHLEALTKAKRAIQEVLDGIKGKVQRRDHGLIYTKSPQLPG